MVAPRRNALSRPVWTDEGLYDGSGTPLWQPQGQYEGPDMASWIGGQTSQFATKTAPEAIRRFNWLRMGYDPQGYLADSAAAGRAGLEIGGELASSLVQPLADLYDSAGNASRYGTPMEPGPTGLNALLNAANFGVSGGALSHAAGDVGDLGMAAGRVAANPDRPAQAVNALAEAGRAPEPSSSRFMNALTGGDRETPGLPMDTEARMARAVELGFNPDAMTFHGTSAPPFSAFDRSSFGSNTKGLAAQQGVFSAYDPDLATYYAETSPQGSSTGQRVLPLLHRSKRRGQIELTGDEMDHEVAATLQEAWKSGYDSVILHGYRHPGDPSKTSSVLVVRDPAQLRSPNAAFDPARKNSADLMAANPRPVGVVVGRDEKDAKR